MKIGRGWASWGCGAVLWPLGEYFHCPNIQNHSQYICQHICQVWCFYHKWEWFYGLTTPLRGQGTSSPVSFEGFRGALYSSFTLGAHNFFLDQLRGVSLALSCQIPPKGNCSMWSYRFPNAIGFGRLEETVTYLSPSLWQFLRRTKWHSSSKIEVPFFHLLLEFSKKTKRFSFGKRLKVGCPETPKTQKILMNSNGLN